MLDLYDIWECDLGLDEKIALANHGIVRRIYSLFETDRSNNCSMFSPAMIFPDQKYDSNQPMYTFIAKCSKGVIIAINKDEYEGDLLNKEISRICSIHQRGDLFIAETYNRFDKNGLRGVHISPDIPLVILVYNSFTNPSQMNLILGDNKRDYCTALDIIYYLDFMDDLDELFDYISYNKEKDYESSFGFGSDAARFFIWKSQGHYIAKGAVIFNLLNVGYDTENEAVVDYFRENLANYPFHDGDYIFKEPFVWKMEKLDYGKIEIFIKYGMGFGGLFIPLPQENYIFLANNVEFYKNVLDFGEYKQLIQLFNEVISEGIESVKAIFNGDYFKQTGIQITFMPREYAVGVGHEEFLHDNREYVYSDAQYHGSKWLIRFVVKNIHQIYQDIQQAKDRETEFGILKEVLYPMLVRLPQILKLFDEESNKYKHNKKKVGVFSTTIDYTWDNNSTVKFFPTDSHFHEVRKRIAQICFSKGIESGTYRGDDANQVIRSMQQAIIEDFENEVSMFSHKKLHISLLECHSSLLHDIYINRQRYGSYEGLDEQKDNEVRERIIRARERAKHDDRNALYLIETNLFLKRAIDNPASTDDICFLIAYANWLVVLNDVADMCHFSEKEAFVEITGEYVVDTMSDNESENVSDLQFRVYQYSDGIARENDIDVQYYKLIKESIKTDLGFEFDKFMEVVSYFSFATPNAITILFGNVYVAEYSNIVDDIETQMSGSISKDEIITILDYLILDTEQLKTIKGKSDFFLPIGNRRDRKVRFELMPLIKNDNEIIFSPITMDHLKKDWINGLFDFILPYDVGMEETKKTLLMWKKQYEEKIVFDVEDVFKKNSFDIVKHNFELKKLSKEHPQYLGDYDVLAINIKSKSVWIIECKVIENIATFYDMFRQQKRFFQEHKEDEKFQRRIDYLSCNLEKVLVQMGVKDCSGFKLISYMCMNKVLESRYKLVGFPIVAYPELVDIINNS